jgi:5'-3' exonuclease|tara:strand:- start:64 stop:942 length:879 start_codon:yes stop_codon:yes gene_type:complete
MKVHLVDGTYELFRHYFGAPSHITSEGYEVGATRAVLASMLSLLEQGATHIGIATDHTITSFRNELYEGYKDGSDIDPDISGQFHILEDLLEAAGFIIFPMVEFEADDALASAAVRSTVDKRVEQVVICTPDKDLGQCLTPDHKIVQYDRRKKLEMNYEAIIEKFGVRPESIPDYLGLMGDTADGFPGLQGWGAKSSSSVLAVYNHIEHIPEDPEKWEVSVRGAKKLAATLNENQSLALLFRQIATLSYDAPTFGSIDELHWEGPGSDFVQIAEKLDSTRLIERAERLADKS